MSIHPETVRPTRAEIDLAAFSRNLDAVRAMLPAGSRLIAVLKADGYGHGAVELARRCSAEKVAMLAVALIEEAAELRNAGITMPILCFGTLGESQLAQALALGITPGVVGPEELALVARASRERTSELAIHLKLDSGMGRMGLVESELADAIAILRESPQVRVDALYTHYANASDPDDSYTATQTANFVRMVAALRDAGIAAPLHHLANSAAIIRGLVAPGDFVRAGIVLYGAEPLDRGGPRLEPLLRWRSEIVRIKDLPAGHPVGYGCTFVTARPSRIATIPVGYADGYDRLLSNRASVLVRGRRIPVAGRVSMDLVTLDVTDFDAAIGDEVVLLGRQGAEEITAEELAEMTGTISYEVFCRISRRVPRVYRAV